jgi:hypothetical protein
VKRRLAYCVVCRDLVKFTRKGVAKRHYPLYISSLYKCPGTGQRPYGTAPSAPGRASGQGPDRRRTGGGLGAWL